MGAIKNGVKTIDDLIAYITPLEPYDQFQDLRLQVIGPEYAAADGTWVNIERVSFNEFEARYRKKHITPDENNEFVYYLNATSDPDHWKYYRKRTINDLGEPVEEYRREDIIVSPWHELPEIITDNLIKIDLGDMEEIQSKNIYIHLINYKMVIRVLDEVGIFPGIDYKPIHLGAIPNGQELELEFKDEEGYENTFWDQTVKGTLWGGINKELDSFDRKIKVEYEKEREGWVSHYPTLIEGNGFRPFALKYKFMPRNGKGKTGGEEKTKLNNLDFPLFEFLNVDDEKRAIKIECKTVYGFLAFTNRTFFAAGSTFDPEVGREEIRQFYSKYIDIVKNAFRERVNTLEELYKLLYYLPNGAFEHVDKMDLWRFLENALGQSVANTITDREDILFKVLKILAKLNSPNVFLLELLRRKVGKKGLLERLIYRLDGDNFTQFVELIWANWKKSKFALFDETKNPALKLDGSSPVLLPYKSDKTLCFHHDNSLIDWDDSYTKIKIVSEIKTGKEVAQTEFMANSTHTVMVDEIVLETYRYHPFAPVVIINEDNPHFIYKDEENPNGQFTVLPAFVMLAREEKAFWDNLMTLAEYAIDIVTTFSGVGNILKAGRLLKVLKAGKTLILRSSQATKTITVIKAFAGGVEITSGIGNGLLKLTGTRDSEFGRAISEYLFFLEIASLSGELGLALQTALKKSAQKALRQTDELAKIEKEIQEAAAKQLDQADNTKHTDTAKEAAEMEEALTHLRDVANDNIKQIFGDGIYGGKILSKADLEEWAKTLEQKFGTKLEKVHGFDDQTTLAQFDSNTNTIKYRENVTEYLMAHESFHAEEMFKLGFDEYVKNAPVKGIKEADYTTENWLNIYRKEKYVYDRLVENAKKYKFNAQEVSTPPYGHAFQYFDAEIVMKLEKRNIPIPKN